MKCLCVRFLNSVRAGGVESTFVQSDRFDIKVLDGTVVRLQAKLAGQVTYVPMTNVAYFEVDESAPRQSPPGSKAPRKSNEE